MQKKTFGSFKLETPESWEEQVVVKLVMPPTKVVADKLIKKQVEKPLATLAITTSEHDDPRAFLTEQLKEMASSFEAFEIVGESDGPDCATTETRFVLGGQHTRQFFAAKKIGKKIVLMTGSAREAVYEATRIQFEAALKSIEEA